MKSGICLALIVGAFALWTNPAPAVEADGRAEVLTLLQRASEAYEQKKFDETGKLIEQVLAKPAFAELPPAVQYAGLKVAAYSAISREDFLGAHEFFLLLSEFEQADASVWLYRAYSALRIEAWPDTVTALTAVAKKFPRELQKQNEFAGQMIFGAAGKLRGEQAKAAKLALYDALFAADFTQPFGSQPSSLWMDLVEDALARNDLERARVVAARITGADALIAMRIDHRFDPLVAAEPKLFDVRATAAREVKRLRAEVAKNPQALAALTQLGYAQYATGEFADLLARTSDAITRATADKDGKPPYDDVGEQLNWIYNQKSLALRALGRWDDALAAMRSGSGAGERASPNVSQTINLGYLLIETGRAQDALAEADRVDWNRGVSPYGRTQLQYVRCVAYLQLGQKDEAGKILAWFREHEADSKQTAQAAYLESGDEDGAAALLIARLRDPDDRALAMLEVQDYRETAQTAQDRKTRVLRDKRLARADVVAAIDAVGRREKQPVYTLEF
jgi:hypothetical protein